MRQELGDVRYHRKHWWREMMNSGEDGAASRVSAALIGWSRMTSLQASVQGVLRVVRGEAAGSRGRRQSPRLLVYPVGA
jgi:hypothetical protein